MGGPAPRMEGNLSRRNAGQGICLGFEGTASAGFLSGIKEQAVLASGSDRRWPYAFFKTDVTSQQRFTFELAGALKNPAIEKQAVNKAARRRFHICFRKRRQANGTCGEVGMREFCC